jgi:hypothetical protein
MQRRVLPDQENRTLADFVRLCVPYSDLAILRPLTSSPVVPLLCPVNALISFPVATSYIRTVLSLNVLMTLRSSRFFQDIASCTQ